ncbi:hypothetical protein P8452_18965 [Trifolium repens]|nr:hypothetical protein P8452_18965 [Trifolium repens]
MNTLVSLQELRVFSLPNLQHFAKEVSRKELSCFMRFPRNRGISPKKRETFTHVQYGLNLSKPPSSTTILHHESISVIGIKVWVLNFNKAFRKLLSL